MYLNIVLSSSKCQPFHSYLNVLRCSFNTYFVNSLPPGRFQFNFRKAIFRLILVNGGWDISFQIALRWMPLDLTDDKSTLVHVMAWCRQAPSHYLSQCWPRSMSPNGITRPQWVKGESSSWCGRTWDLCLFNFITSGNRHSGIWSPS